MSKLIGITPRIVEIEGVKKEFVNSRYIKPLVERGFNVIMLTLDNPNPNEILSLCDGFLITGGSDVDPVHFNENNEGLSKNVEPALDLLDRYVVNYAKDHKVPTLGICRGHQVINVFLGGTLHQDIGNDHKSVKEGHEVITYKNDILTLDEKIYVNSYHHQAIKTIAPDFIEIAKHLDGTNEAIIHKTLPIIGIQWHPEMRADSEVSKIIFDAFANFVNNQ